MGRGLTQFVYDGMVADKWPFLTLESIQYHLDEPESLDDQELWNDFVDDLFGWVHLYFVLDRTTL